MIGSHIAPRHTIDDTLYASRGNTKSLCDLCDGHRPMQLANLPNRLLCQFCNRPSSHVICTGNRFQVFWINATRIATEVVDFIAIRDRANERQVGCPVRAHSSPVDVNRTVSIRPKASPPKPTTGLCINDIRKALGITTRVVSLNEASVLPRHTTSCGNCLLGDVGLLTTPTQAQTRRIRIWKWTSSILMAGDEITEPAVFPPSDELSAATGAGRCRKQRTGAWLARPVCSFVVARSATKRAWTDLFAAVDARMPFADATARLAPVAVSIRGRCSFVKLIDRLQLTAFWTSLDCESGTIRSRHVLTPQTSRGVRHAGGVATLPGLFVPPQYTSFGLNMRRMRRMEEVA